MLAAGTLGSVPTFSDGKNAMTNPASPRCVLSFTGTPAELLAYLDRFAAGSFAAAGLSLAEVVEWELTATIVRHPAGKGLRACEECHDSARARLAAVEAERDTLRAALFGAHQDQEMAEARLAAVEALCDAITDGANWKVAGVAVVSVDRVRAAARGES